MNTLTEETLKELEKETAQDGEREQWLIYAGQLWEQHARALISTAREVSRLRAALEAYAPCYCDTGHTCGRCLALSPSV